RGAAHEILVAVVFASPQNGSRYRARRRRIDAPIRDEEEPVTEIPPAAENFFIVYVFARMVGHVRGDGGAGLHVLSVYVSGAIFQYRAHQRARPHVIVPLRDHAREEKHKNGHEGDAGVTRAHDFAAAPPEEDA